MRGLLNNSFSPYWFDRSSPLADRLTILWHAAANRELISGAFGVPSGTTPPTADVADLVGNSRVIKVNGAASATQSYLSFGSHPEHADIALVNQPFSAFAVLALNAVSGPIMGHNDNNTINAGWVFDIASAGSAVRLRAEHASANYTAAVGLPTTTTRYNSPMTAVCFTCDGSHSATAGTAAVYFNGAPTVGGITLSAGSGITGSDAAQTLYMGGNQSGMSGAVSLTCAVEMCAVWRRQLTAGEVMKLSLDRLQLFRRRSQLRTIGVIPPVSGTTINPVVQTTG